jgi:hypothetical protein
MTDDRSIDRDLADRELSAADARRTDELGPGDGVTGERAPREREVTIVRKGGAADVASPRAAPLLPPDVTGDLRMRWMEVQTAFVDEPRTAVQRADGLVAEAIQRLGDSFASARAELEREWDRGDGVSTEDLRQALQRYRAFFSRVLEV